MRTAVVLGLALTVVLNTRPAAAQLINSGTGNISAGDSFSESIGTNWGARGRGWFFNFGGGTPGLAPPFGGVPGGLSGGLGFAGGGLSGGLGFTAGQGSSRSLTSTSSSVTSLNGAPSFIFDGTLRPFITEITPVVGSRPPMMISPLALKLQQAGGVQGLRPPMRLPQRQATEPAMAADESEAPRRASGNGLGGSGSSADRGDLSVAAIRRQQAAEEAALEAELNQFIAEANRLSAAGDNRGAALQYSKAAAKVEGDRRAEFLAKARALRTR